VNEEPEAATERDIAWQILRHLEQHPAAKDTLDGIAQWWLRPERSDPSREEVEGAVAFLISRGFLLETRRPGVPPYYQLNDKRREEISKLLKGWAG
jgi:hypothetical protein